MRVGIDVSPLTRTRTGVGHYTYYLLKQLLAAGGASYHGFSSGWGEMDAEALAGLDGARHLRVPTRALYKLWSWTNRPRADALLGGVDVYHATNYFLPPVQRAKRVLTLYDLAFLKHPEWCSPKIVGPFSEGVRRFSREADALITCSEAAKRDMVELLGAPPEKVTVAQGAVDAALGPMTREAAAAVLERHGIAGPYVLFVSTLEPRKNVAGLIEAFARIAGEIPHTLVLVGQWGWGAEPIREALEAAQLGNRVRQVGYVDSHASLAAFYSGADAFFFPSFYEGFGLPVLEAMCCGAPVITSDRASLPEVGGDAARYVDPGDAEAMAGELRAVLQDAPLRARMREAGFDQARRFSWAACAARTFEVYRRLA